MWFPGDSTRKWVVLLCLLPWLASCDYHASGPFSAWDYTAPLAVHESAGLKVVRFPVELRLDTKTLIANGKMREDAADLRITIAGQEVPIQMEKVNTSNTVITVQIDLQPNERRGDVALYCGNPAARSPAYDVAWGSVTPSRDGFANELLNISYGMKVGTFGWEWPCQKEFVIKAVNEDQFGSGGGKSRNDVTYWDRNRHPVFDIEAEGPIYRRVRFHTNQTESMDHGILTNLTQKVTLYRESPFLKEEYDNIRGAVVDVASPGGMPLRTNSKRNFDFVASKLNSSDITWEGIGDDHETRGGWSADRERALRDARYRYLDEYLQDGYFVMGVFNIHNGRGIASATVGDDIQTCYFVDWSGERAGYSLWPRQHGRLVRYFYYIENGPEEAITKGDLFANPPTVSIGEWKFQN